MTQRFERGVAALALALLLALTISPANAGAAGADPDASITAKDITLSFYDPAEGDSVIITAHVEYHISAPDTDVIVELVVDGRMWSYTGFTAGPNETSMDVGFIWIATKGEHIITIALDPHNDIMETDEGNNNASINLHGRALPVNPPETNWTLWVAVALVLVAGVALAALAVRSIRRKRERSGGAGEPHDEDTNEETDIEQAKEKDKLEDDIKAKEEDVKTAEEKQENATRPDSIDKETVKEEESNRAGQDED